MKNKVCPFLCIYEGVMEKEKTAPANNLAKIQIILLKNNLLKNKFQEMIVEKIVLKKY